MDLYVKFRGRQVLELIVHPYSDRKYWGVCEGWYRYVLMNSLSEIKMVPLKYLKLVWIEEFNRYGSDIEEFGVAFINDQFDSKKDLFCNDSILKGRPNLHIKSMTDHSLILSRFQDGHPVYREKNLREGHFDKLKDWKF